MHDLHAIEIRTPKPAHTSSLPSLLVHILLVIAGVYVLYGILLYVFQRTLLFPGTSLHVERNPAMHAGAELVRLPAGAAEMEAWFVPSESTQGTAPAIIFAHGNYETIDSAFESVAFYSSLGVNLLLVEYPGYGRNSGSPSEAAVVETFTAAHDWLVREKGIQALRNV